MMQITQLLGESPPDENAVVVLEIKLPVGIAELAAVGEAMVKIHGKDLFMRQVGPMLQIFKLK